MPLHPPGPSCFIIFCARSIWSSDISPLFLAKAMHSSRWELSSQYVLHAALLVQPPGPPSRSTSFSTASSLSLSMAGPWGRSPRGGIRPFFSAKAWHSAKCSLLLQYCRHALPVQPPGPVCPINLRAVFISSLLIMPRDSAKLRHASACVLSSQYALHSALELHPPSSAMGKDISGWPDCARAMPAPARSPAAVSSAMVYLRILLKRVNFNVGVRVGLHVRAGGVRGLRGLRGAFRHRLLRVRCRVIVSARAPEYKPGYQCPCRHAPMIFRLHTMQIIINNGPSSIPRL